MTKPKESAVESEFVPVELARRSIRLGFNLKPLGTSYDFSGTTLEQLERWIWAEHQYYSIITAWSGSKTIDGNVAFHVHSQFGDYIGKFPDPFSARLAGVERAIEIIEDSQCP